MQPQHVEEIHLVFKARQPAGLEAVQGSGSSQANSQQQQDLQKLRNMLQSGVYFVKLIGTIVDKDATHDHEGDGEVCTNGDAFQRLPNRRSIDWVFEFKDTPEAGQQATITRLISRTKFADGDRIAFLNFFGYEYVSYPPKLNFANVLAMSNATMLRARDSTTKTQHCSYIGCGSCLPSSQVRTL